MKGNRDTLWKAPKTIKEHNPRGYGPRRTEFWLKRDTQDNWLKHDPVLREYEVVWESDTDRFKVGDGQRHYSELPYYAKPS